MSLGRHIRVGHCLLAGLKRALNQVGDQLLQLGARQLADQVLGAGRIRGNEGQVDFSFDGGR